MNTSPTTQKSGSLFVLILQLTAALLLAQFIFSATNDSGNYFLAGHFGEALGIPWTIVGAIVFFLAVIILLHFLFALLIWLLSKKLGDMLQLNTIALTRLTVILWLLGVLWIFFANQFFYPNSQFAQVTGTLVPDLVAEIVLILISIIFSLAILLLFCSVTKNFVQRRHWLRLSILFICIIGALFLLFRPQPLPANYHNQRPNVIIIGFDSLRPKNLGYYGNNPSPTPHIDQFLSESTNFSQMVVPLARTFASWLSMLTGVYPRTTGAREDLVAENQLHFPTPFPKILQQSGYETIYAIDDNRFSNINKSYGFNQILGPKVGANNFILGTFNDFPLTNLLVNTLPGSWLFPYNYINRDSIPTYYPAVFNRELGRALGKNYHKPVLFIVHYCLPHYPYFWAKKTAINHIPRTTADVAYLYREGLKGADEQFVGLWEILKRNHLLDNAIVVLLSDHGEGLGHNERVTTIQKYVADPQHPQSILQKVLYEIAPDYSLDFSFGHGGDILSPNQNHGLFSFRLFGQPNQHVEFPFNVSSLDLKPTILQLLGVPDTQPGAGLSLANFITGKQPQPDMSSRHFYLESGMDPDTIHFLNPHFKTAFTETTPYFRIDSKTGLVNIKTSKLPLLLSYKQRAILAYPWLLALYPDRHNQLVPVIANLQTGLWSDRLDSPFAQQSPASLLLKQLKDFYGDEINLNSIIRN